MTETTDIRRRVMPRRQLLRKFLNGEELPERERARAEKIMSDLEGPGSVGLPGPAGSTTIRLCTGWCGSS